MTTIPSLQLKPISGVYLMHSIRALAAAFIGLYVPIYLLQLNYSIQIIFVFWLIYSLSLFFSYILATLLSQHIGLKKILVASILLQFINLFILHQLQLIYIPIPLIAFLTGLQSAFYWCPVNIFFATHSDTKQMGKSVGKLFALPKIIKLPIPIVAGLIIIYFNFNTLFVIAGIFYLLSLLPLLSVPEFTSQVSFKLPKYILLFKNYPGYFFAELAENIREEVEGIILPIFIFLTFKNILSVGAISTVASFGSILFTLFIGKLTDNNNKKILFRLGAIIMILAWILRFFVQSQLIFFAISLLVGFVEILILVPFTSIIYTNAKNNNPVEFLLFREISVVIARTLVYTTAIILATNINYLFILPIVSLIYFLFYK